MDARQAGEVLKHLRSKLTVVRLALQRTGPRAEALPGPEHFLVLADNLILAALERLGVKPDDDRPWSPDEILEREG